MFINLNYKIVSWIILNYIEIVDHCILEIEIFFVFVVLYVWLFDFNQYVL